MCVVALWQEQMETPTLKTCKVEEDLRPWAGKTLQRLFLILVCSQYEHARCV